MNVLVGRDAIVAELQLVDSRTHDKLEGAKRRSTVSGKAAPRVISVINRNGGVEKMTTVFILAKSFWTLVQEILEKGEKLEL
jgi:hypothetical protein